VRFFRQSYRHTSRRGKPSEWTATEIGRLLDRCFAPENFFLAPGVELEWEHRNEEIPWEIFKGRLLEPAYSRISQAFEARNAYWVEQGCRSSEPILSLKLDYSRRQLHVVRAILCHVWEGYDAGSNVILSRETPRWVRELVGTVFFNQFESGSELHDEIVCQLFQAVVGSSRLPLTSLEAPLPAFALGQMAYFLRSSGEGKAGLLRSFQDLMRQGLSQEVSQREKVKLLETVLRATAREQLSEMAGLLVARWTQIGHELRELPALFRELFEELSLSPYTDFVDKTLLFIELLEQQGLWTTEDRVDFLSWLLRHVGRHLTAYDLVTFHHRGANYPDALLIDAVLKSYLRLIAARPDIFLSEEGEADKQKRIRRRGLRQAWLLRRWYEGHPVPETPTSPGENARVLPASYPRVPEDEILQPDKRRKRLFENDELSRYWHDQADSVLRQSVRDLSDPNELKELGMALFLDRPLGAFKNPGELDQTPLLSYEAFSRSIAARRLRFLAEKSGLLTYEDRTGLEEKLRNLRIEGLSLLPEGEAARLGSVSISDALKASPDFIILRTTKKSAEDFMNCFHFEVLDSHLLSLHRAGILVIRESGKSSDAESLLSIYDCQRVKRLQLSIDSSQGYQRRAGLELPRAGLRLRRAWDADGQLIEMPSIPIPLR
jgi:hypothetical protein